VLTNEQIPSALLTVENLPPGWAGVPSEAGGSTDGGGSRAGCRDKTFDQHGDPTSTLLREQQGELESELRVASVTVSAHQVTMRFKINAGVPTDPPN